MLVISPVLTAVVYAAVVPLTLCVFLIKHAVRVLFRAHRAKDSNRNAFIVESITGEKVIKSNNRSEYNRAIYRELQNYSAGVWMSIVKRNGLNSPVTEFFWNAGILAIFAVAFALIANGATAMAGTVIAFMMYMSLCSEPFIDITEILQLLAQVSANLERVYEVLDTPVAIADKADAVTLENIDGVVDYNDVTFAYDEGINVLEHFDLHVRAGEKIALVGPTGAGKTTVINLLTRFYDVNTGSVCVDGKDVREVTLQSLRRNVGVLMQEPFIFKGSILDNIRYGAENATDEECIAAAKLANADGFIRMLPEGYNTVLSGDGSGLSQGQRQLISIARAAVADPPVMILDEATSSIDTHTEAIVQRGMDALMEGRTVFVIAHRLSTVKNSDVIMVLDHGRIIERGSHEKLISEKGQYYKLYTGAFELE